LKESGIYDYWMKQCLNDNQLDGKTDAEQVIQQDVEPLTLNSLSGVFKILLFGLTFSTIVFILEWIHYLFSKTLVLKVNAIIRSSNKFLAHFISLRAHRINPYY